MSDSDCDDLPPVESFTLHKGESRRIPAISLQDLIEESNKTTSIFDRIKKIKLDTPEKPSQTPDPVSCVSPGSEKGCAEEMDYYDVNSDLQAFELAELWVDRGQSECHFDFACSLMELLSPSLTVNVGYHFLNGWLNHVRSFRYPPLNEKPFTALYLLLNRADCQIIPMAPDQAHLFLCSMLTLISIFKDSLALRQVFSALHSHFHFSPNIYALCIKKLVIWADEKHLKILSLSLMLEALWVVDSALVRQVAILLLDPNDKKSIIEQLQTHNQQEEYIKLLQLAIIYSYIGTTNGTNAMEELKELKQFESTLTVFVKESVTIAKDYLFQMIKRQCLIKGLSK